MPALSDELKNKILAYLPRYPSKQAVTLPALHLVHDEQRCVSREAIKEIADLLNLAPAEVHDAMTFYQFFREENAPLGKTRLWVCRSLACSLRGGEGSILGVVLGTILLQVLQNLVNLLGIPSSLNFAVIGGVILIGVLADQQIVRRRQIKQAKKQTAASGAG